MDCAAALRSIAVSEQVTQTPATWTVLALRIGAVIIGLALAGASLLSLVRQDRPTDPPYSEVVAHLQALPGASCDGTAPDISSQVCTWGRWTLTLQSGSRTVAEFCRDNRDHHVWFGFGGWHLSVAPVDQVAQLPALPNDEYSALQGAFDFGSGGAWQAC